MIVSNDTCRRIAQVNTLISRVAEALLLFLPDHLVHTSRGTIIKGSGAPIIAVIPPIRANPAVNTVLEASPGRGAGVSKITPDSICLTTSLTEAIIEATTAAACGAPCGVGCACWAIGSACWTAGGSGVGSACWSACWTAIGSALIVHIFTAAAITVLAIPGFTNPHARNTIIASVRSNTIAVGVVAAIFKGDEHVVVDDVHVRR